MQSGHKPLRGSEFVPLEGARLAGAIDDDEVIEVTVVVRAAKPIRHHYDHQHWHNHPHEHPPLTEDQHRARRSTADDIDRVRAFAESHGLEVVEASEKRRAVVLEGRAHDLANAFGVELVRYEHAHGDHHAHEGPIHLPEELIDVVIAVLGLNDRPIASRQLPEAAVDAPSDGLLRATELAEIYDFPQDFDGTGQKIGIIQLSDKRTPAGYRKSDLDAFFADLGLPTPTIRDVVRRKSANAPESEADVARFMTWMRGMADGTATMPEAPTKGRNTAEVVMDIELVGALAPGAELVVYFTDNSEGGVYHVLNDILEAGEVSVISFSWAWKEHGDSFEDLIDELLGRAADPAEDRPAITFCSASGDYGGSRLCYPAASPWALACGGTRLATDPAGQITESVWNTQGLAASGGGVGRSTQPAWQQGCEPDTGRGIPDVAAVADPTSHCRILAGGVWGPAAGTSATAPIWAALMARFNHSLGVAQGYVNPRFYKLSRARPDLFRSVTEGDNIVKGKGFQAREGWDPCTGLGSPRGTALLDALRPA
jgi:kumamolisin